MKSKGIVLTRLKLVVTVSLSLFFFTPLSRLSCIHFSFFVQISLFHPDLTAICFTFCSRNLVPDCFSLCLFAFFSLFQLKSRMLVSFLFTALVSMLHYITKGSIVRSCQTYRLSSDTKKNMLSKKLSRRVNFMGNNGKAWQHLSLKNLLHL